MGACAITWAQALTVSADGRKNMTEGRRTANWRRADPVDPEFKIASSPFYWLARVEGRYTLGMDAVLKRIEMDVPRWRVLMLLTEHSPASVSELSEHAIIRLSTMTKIVLRMKAEGYVDTRVSATDGRVTEVLLMPKGQQAVKQVRAQAGRIFQQAFRDLSASQLAGLNDALQKIFHNLDNAND
jgi:MarR family transcriptional regulator, organic hydroperoxide resistance regulator